MTRINFKNCLSLLLYQLLILVSACSYDEAPLVFDPNAQSNAAPMISRVEPQSAAFAGFTEIRIVGDNFSTRTADNVVYFGNEKAQIISVAKTEIKVIPPNLIAENLAIKVVVAGAVTIAEFKPYNLKSISVEYGNFTDLDLVYALAVDANENVYADLRGVGVVSIVLKITPQGDKTEFGRTNFPQAIEMHVGPGGELYLHRSLGNLFKIGAGGGDSQPFSTLPSRTFAFDFDANGNIFAAGNRSGAFMVNASGAPANTGRFPAYDVRALRVFNGYVYVAALYLGTDPVIPKSGIWRSQILSAAGNLGNEELVFDWANSGEFAGARFFALTFSQDGEIYVGTNHTDPILRIRTDGSSEAVYKGLLKPDAAHLVWGNGDFLYMNRGSTVASNRRVLRIDMGKKGAPYHGRR
ncbi:MAG: IPT/TIG domain-containing protein [bacterium]